MSFASILSTVEGHIKEYETAITNSLANHNGLLGGLAALQRTLGVLTPIIESLEPSVAPIMDVVDAVVTDVENLIPAAPAAPAAPAEAPVAA